jgi:DNA-binding beta-propeller fold protein YncE
MRRQLLLGALLAALVGLGTGTAQAAEAPSHQRLFELRELPPAGSHNTLNGPCGLAVDGAGKIYVSDYYNDRIVVLSPTGVPQNGLAEVDPLDGPCGLAVDPAGDLFVNDYHRSVLRFAAPWSTATVLDAGNSPSTSLALRPTGVAIDPATGRIYVDDRTYIAEYEGSTLLRKIGLGSLGDAYGLAVSDYPATNGYLYVPDAQTDTIKVYDPATSTTSPVAEIDGEGMPQGGFSDLTDAALAVDSVDGHLFVASYAEGALFEHPPAALDEFNSAGDFRGRILPTELIAGGPSGLAVSPPGAPTAGDLYVTSGNSERGRLFGLAPTGAAHTLKVAKTGTGTGTVTSQPAGIRCGAACAAEFNAGAQVTLTATPAPGSTFAGWSGGSCSGTGACQLSMSEDREVFAGFEPAPAPALAGPSSGPGAGATLGGSAPSPAAPAQGTSSTQSAVPTTDAVPARHYVHKRKHRRHHHGRRRRR